MFIAGALQSLAWLAALISLQRSRRPQHWLALAAWHLPPIALALGFLPKAIAGAVPSEDIPLAVALGLELGLVGVLDWQQAVQHALAREDPLQQPLLRGKCSSCALSITCLLPFQLYYRSANQMINV